MGTTRRRSGDIFHSFAPSELLLNWPQRQTKIPNYDQDRILTSIDRKLPFQLTMNHVSLFFPRLNRETHSRTKSPRPRTIARALRAPYRSS